MSFDEQAVGREWGWPVMLKSRLLAYDGRGNAVARDEQQAQQAFDALGGKVIFSCGYFSLHYSVVYGGCGRCSMLRNGYRSRRN